MTSPQQQQEFEAAIQQHIQQAVAAALAGMPPPAAPAPPTVNVNAVAVKLPEFWPADPQTWFHQAEAAFRRSNVVTSYTKYDHVLLKLPTDVVMTVNSQHHAAEHNGRLRAVEGVLDRQLREDQVAAGQHTVGHAAVVHAAFGGQTPFPSDA
jgi:hypothetical protein